MLKDSAALPKTRSAPRNAPRPSLAAPTASLWRGHRIGGSRHFRGTWERERRSASRPGARQLPALPPGAQSSAAEGERARAHKGGAEDARGPREGARSPPLPRRLPSATQRARGDRSGPPGPPAGGGRASGRTAAAASGDGRARGAEAPVPPGPPALPPASLRWAPSRARQWRIAAASGGRRRRRPPLRAAHPAAPRPFYLGFAAGRGGGGGGGGEGRGGDGGWCLPSQEFGRSRRSPAPGAPAPGRGRRQLPAEMGDESREPAEGEEGWEVGDGSREPPPSAPAPPCPRPPSPRGGSIRRRAEKHPHRRSTPSPLQCLLSCPAAIGR